ncbi:MAG: ABC transporter ATP-binding protein [Aquificaceae bacterium]|nr:ABC transporter ATP-binding protein/permease [Aquificaceae bacterium]MDW8032099.1 ABC transporter ATP-binding protein [Aquificaceae bacterium]MDW8294400.1 ABC transporter ATP-binding protein [Aquificaceae bacterium]
MEHIKWVLLRLKAYLHFIFLSLCGSLLEAGGTAGVSLLIKSLVDKVFLLREEEELLKVVLSLLGFVFIAQLGRLTSAFFSALYTELEMKKLREEAFGKLLRADYSAFLGFSPGEFASRVISDMNLYRNLIGSYGVKLIREPTTVLFLVGVLLYRDWFLTLSLFLLLPLLAFAVKYFGKKRGKHLKRSQEGYAEVADRLFSSFSGFESIRSFRAQPLFERLFRELSRALFRSGLRSEVYFALNSVFNFTFGYSVVALVILYGGFRIAEGSLTAGDFLSYLTALLFLQTPLMETQKGFMEFRASLPVVGRIREVLSLEEERAGRFSFEALGEGIEVENLRVSVGGRLLLKGVNLKIRKGEKLGLMGDTGSGKSTLLRVLAGLLPYEGSVRVGGLELADINREDLREAFLFLSQEPFIFPGTVRENLLLAGEKEEELIRALQLSECDFVKSLDQPLNPKSLSGGEKQRLALARVFLKSPQLLLLDEVTSALDARKEERVLDNLFTHFRDSTFILVAHRFSNLLRCDRVLVMKEGLVVFEGKPKEAIDFFLQSP